MKKIIMTIALTVLAASAYAQYPCDPDPWMCYENADPGGDGSGSQWNPGDICKMCAYTAPPDAECVIMPSWNLRTNYSQPVTGALQCVEHNVPVGPGWCAMSGLECTDRPAKNLGADMLSSAWSFKAEIMRQFVFNHPNTNENELARRAETHGNGRTLYEFYRSEAARLTGVLLADGAVAVWPERIAKEPSGRKI